MIQTEQEIKAAQLKKLRTRLKELLGFRQRRHEFVLHDLLEALKKEDIPIDSFSIFIATDTHCVANITKYQNYKKLNPLVWFLHFGMEDQPSYTIDFFYRLFFQETRILQASKTTKLTIRYESSNQKNTITNYGGNSIHGSNRRSKRVGSSETGEYRRINP